MKAWRSSVRWAAPVAVFCAVLCGSARAQTEGTGEGIARGPWRISGTVVSSRGGGTLARVRVTIADVKNRRIAESMITADDGRFEFRVPAGKYSLEGAKRGFIAAAYDRHEQFSTAIVTGADFDTETLVLRLAPNAVLTGKVLDEFGEPVRNAQVMVYRENHYQGVSRIVGYRGAMTDDEGRYEAAELDEGTYFVSASGSPWYAVHPSTTGEGATGSPPQVDASLDVAYPITYYGDATEANDATPIPVRGGDRLEADIHLNPVPALHLVVHTREGEVQPPVLQKPGFDDLDQERVPVADIRNNAAGEYELTGVPAGRYTLLTRNANGQATEMSEVNLTGGGELDASLGNPMSTIQARVRLESGQKLPSHLQIGLRNSRGKSDVAQVDDKGEVKLNDISPGEYDVEVFSPSQPQAYAVTRIGLESGIVSGHALNVPPGASLSISLVLVGSSVTVEGFAKRAGKGTSGAMIVLVPKNPEVNHDRFRRDQSDLDGSFRLPNVIPGQYTVIAIEDGWDLDWSEPAVLARYVEHGQTIEVGARSAAPMHLTDAVPVQAK
ncbi:MAG: carboxypeptidase-like regulatory domain-containing protein [Terriglobales bacterium]